MGVWHGGKAAVGTSPWVCHAEDKMKVLANDGLADEGIALLEKHGFEVDTTKRAAEALVEDIGGFDGLIVRSATKVTRQVIEAGRRLKVIGRAGVGYDNVDVEAASEQGIVVKFAPYGNTNATAELALGLMLALSRNIPQADGALKRGVWLKREHRGVELSGKVLGIIGCGRIGHRLAELVRGFDMSVIGYDPYPIEDSRISFVPTVRSVLSNADYVSVHTGGREEVIGAAQLGWMKPTAYLINTSRGFAVNEVALVEALQHQKIAGAGLDVYSKEPKGEGKPFDLELRGLDNVVLTPHLGASTVEAQRKTGVEIAEAVIGYLTRGDWRGSVNAGEEVTEEDRPTYPLFIFHKDTPGMFAKIDTVLGDHGVNIREISARTVGSAGNVQAAYLLHNKVTAEVVEVLSRIEGVFSVKQ